MRGALQVDAREAARRLRVREAHACGASRAAGGEGAGERAILVLIWYIHQRCALVSSSVRRVGAVA